MGRAPLKLELIKSAKKRNLTFQQRKKCLFKKANELSMLCDVKLGIIIYGPESNHQPEIWQQGPDDIKELIYKYKNQPTDQKVKRCKDLSIFFEDQMNKSKSDLQKMRKKNNEALYPTWNDWYNELSEEQLRKLARDFEDKLEVAKTRLDSLKGFTNLQALDLGQHSYNELDYIDSSSHLIENQMMMELMNYGEPPLDGGAFCYDPMVGTALNNAMPPMFYGGPSLQEQFYVTTAGPSSSDLYCCNQNFGFN